VNLGVTTAYLGGEPTPFSRAPALLWRISLRVEENNDGPVKGKFRVASPTMSHRTRRRPLKDSRRHLGGEGPASTRSAVAIPGPQCQQKRLRRRPGMEPFGHQAIFLDPPMRISASNDLRAAAISGINISSPSQPSGPCGHQASGAAYSSRSVDDHYPASDRRARSDQINADHGTTRSISASNLVRRRQGIALKPHRPQRQLLHCLQPLLHAKNS